VVCVRATAAFPRVESVCGRRELHSVHLRIAQCANTIQGGVRAWWHVMSAGSHLPVGSSVASGDPHVRKHSPLSMRHTAHTAAPHWKDPPPGWGRSNWSRDLKPCSINTHAACPVCGWLRRSLRVYIAWRTGGGGTGLHLAAAWWARWGSLRDNAWGQWGERPLRASGVRSVCASVHPRT